MQTVRHVQQELLCSARPTVAGSQIQDSLTSLDCKCCEGVSGFHSVQELWKLQAIRVEPAFTATGISVASLYDGLLTSS